MNNKSNPLKDKSYSFALQIIKIYTSIVTGQREYVLSKQLLRSGTSIGANIEEANRAESKNDFIHKLAIANKEAGETAYWIRLLRDSSILDVNISTVLLNDCDELLKMIVSSINTAKRNKNI
jgi:four helix bundle protein